MARPRTLDDDQILAAAHRVLLARGPHAFTLADVAGECGLSPAALVQRFGSKRGLLVAFCRRAAANASTPFEGAAKLERSPLRALRRALRASVESVTSRTALANSLALLLEDVRDDELRAAAAEHARRTQEHIRLLVVAADKAGELDVRDPARHAAAIQAARDGALVQWALRGDGPLGDWVVDCLAPLLSGRGRGRRRA